MTEILLVATSYMYTTLLLVDNSPFYGVLLWLTTLHVFDFEQDFVLCLTGKHCGCTLSCYSRVINLLFPFSQYLFPALDGIGQPLVYIVHFCRSITFFLIIIFNYNYYFRSQKTWILTQSQTVITSWMF